MKFTVHVPPDFAQAFAPPRAFDPAKAHWGKGGEDLGRFYPAPAESQPSPSSQKQAADGLGRPRQDACFIARTFFPSDACEKWTGVQKMYRPASGVFNLWAAAGREEKFRMGFYFALFYNILK